VGRRPVAGVAYAGLGISLGVGAGLGLRSTAPAVGLAAAGRMLRRTAIEVGEMLDRDLDEARSALPALVGRDPTDLDESGVAAAVVESVAENTVDAVVAPALWGAVAGAPGALAHRAVNTLDAMVGHRSPRHERFGWASAKADDAANWVPARVTAALVVAAAPGSASRVIDAVRAGGSRHPSPNAGLAESAFAGALGVELGGPLRYGDRHEDRPRLGAGPRPTVADIRRAVALESRVEWLLVGLLAAGAAVVWRRR
jgi:adenosylcobinamide-phosphate synthase